VRLNIRLSGDLRASATGNDFGPTGCLTLVLCRVFVPECPRIYEALLVGALQDLAIRY